MAAEWKVVIRRRRKIGPLEFVWCWHRFGFGFVRMRPPCSDVPFKVAGVHLGWLEIQWDKSSFRRWDEHG